jgi:hypothetical protein
MSSKFILSSTQPFILYCNSKNRSSPNTPSSLFTIQLSFPPLHVSRITLLDAIIPNTFYTFRNDAYLVNNNFDFIDSSGTEKTAIITPGTYDSAQFITEFTADLMAVSPDTYTVTLDPTNLILTITSNSALFRILGATGNNVGHNILYFIGFNNVDTTAGTTQIAPNVINLGSPREIFIKCANFQTPIHDTNNNFVALFQIGLNVPFGNIVYYEQFDRHESGVNIEQRTLNSLFLELVDENGILVLPNTDWSCLLRFD